MRARQKLKQKSHQQNTNGQMYKKRVEVTKERDAAFESLVVWSVEITTESETALLSAVLVRSESEATLLSLVVCNVEITTLSDTPFESAVEVTKERDAALLSLVV